MIIPQERITKNVIDFAGGLGDVLNVFYLTNAYKILEEDKNNLVLLRSHNKYVKDFIVQQGYTNIFDLSSAWENATGEFFIEAKDKLQNICGLDITNINFIGILERGYRDITKIPDSSSVKFVIDKKEELFLDLLKSKNIVCIHPTAGSLDRNIPDIILLDIIDNIVSMNCTPVILGNTNRITNYRKEVINLENLNFSVGFSVELIKMCKYFVGTHSSMNLVAWHNRIKSLILMPESTYISHFFHTLEEKTVWNFGAFESINKVMLFHTYDNKTISELIEVV